jgi:hypothetical protein
MGLAHVPAGGFNALLLRLHRYVCMTNMMAPGPSEGDDDGYESSQISYPAARFFHRPVAAFPRRSYPHARERAGRHGGGGNQPDTPCQQAQNLPIGSWHRFVEGEKCIDARLAWRSTGGGVLIFTDGQGQRVNILSAITVELMLRAGTLQSPTQPTR